MFYVHYDDQGNLLSVTNEVRSNEAFVTIDQTTFTDFVSGKENLLDFIVLEGIDNAEPTLVRKGQLENFDVDKSIHEIERISSTNSYKLSAFYIIQDKKKKKWQGKAKLSEGNRVTLLNNKYLNKIKKIYVTEENNPNILRGELAIDMKKFTANKLFDIQTNDKSLVFSDDISLYCPVLYEKFYHIVKEQDV